MVYKLHILWDQLTLKGKKMWLLNSWYSEARNGKINDKPVVQRSHQKMLPVQPTSSKLISSLMAYSMILSQHKSNMYRFKVASSVKYF